MPTKKVYQILSSALQARENCVKSGNAEWKVKHEATIASMCDRLPHGSGVDSGTKLDMDRSNGRKLVFQMDFHHMTEGSYSGWSEHTVMVIPAFEDRDQNLRQGSRSDQGSFARDSLLGSHGRRNRVINRPKGRPFLLSFPSYVASFSSVAPI